MKIYKCKCGDFFTQEQGDCFNGQFSCPYCNNEIDFTILGDDDYDIIKGWNA